MSASHANKTKLWVLYIKQKLHSAAYICTYAVSLAVISDFFLLSYKPDPSGSVISRCASFLFVGAEFVCDCT